MRSIPPEPQSSRRPPTLLAASGQDHEVSNKDQAE
jgi:hypothetical protein